MTLSTWEFGTCLTKNFTPAFRSIYGNLCMLWFWMLCTCLSQNSAQTPTGVFWVYCKIMCPHRWTRWCILLRVETTDIFMESKTHGLILIIKFFLVLSFFWDLLIKFFLFFYCHCPADLLGSSMLMENVLLFVFFLAGCMFRKSYLVLFLFTGLLPWECDGVLLCLQP